MAVHNFLFGKRSNVALIADFFALIAAASAGLKKEGKSSSGCAQEFRLCLLQGATKLCNSFLSLLEMTISKIGWGRSPFYLRMCCGEMDRRLFQCKYIVIEHPVYFVGLILRCMGKRKRHRATRNYPRFLANNCNERQEINCFHRLID
jgi:hypothetical protein